MILIILILIICFLFQSLNVRKKYIESLEERIAILEIEKKNTRRVMYENGLIPKKFVD